MDLYGIVSDLRIWVVSALIIGFLLPSIEINASLIIVVALMIQMVLSVDGIRFSNINFGKDRKVFVAAVILCFGFNTLVTLAAGALFIHDNVEMWYGWAMLAVMPCAVSTISTALIKQENLETAVVAVSSVYIAAIMLSPLLSYALMGDAIRPAEILMYIVLFIAIPLIVSIPLRKLNLKRKAKIPFINLTLSIVIMLSVNRNRDFIMDSSSLMIIIVAVAIVRVVLLHYGSKFLISRMGMEEDSRTTFLVLSVWKNTGLSVSMCMALLADMPQAVIPCIISLLIEDVWFSIVAKADAPDRLTTEQ